jgi:low affinity Fe/Cu permease
MQDPKEKNWLERAGCAVSEWVADIAGHPFAQIGFVLLCAIWFLAGWNVNLLTAGLSILAITLTQMVLNRQNEREIDDHRRDVGMHAKLDELIAVSRQASNEFVAVEEKEEEEIVHLKDGVKEAIDETSLDVPDARERAKRAVDAAASEVAKHPRRKSGSGKSTVKGRSARR